MLVVGEAAGDFVLAGAPERAAMSAQAWERGETSRSISPGSTDSSDATLAPNATVCLCEDVTVAAIDTAIAEGFGDIELLKRRSGACTGPCQGKLCLGTIGEVLRARGLPAGLPTIRPPTRPVSIGSLAGEPS
jgi:NAD(P)H-nitrite reductase large subunit